MKRTITVPEAVQLLGIGRNQAYEAARRGELPTIKIGKRILVPRSALEAMLSAGTATPTSATPAPLGRSRMRRS